MADSDEDIYCNPQSNVFLQTKLHKNVNKKAVQGKKKPPPPVIGRSLKNPSTGDELGGLFKEGLMKPSELKKNPTPIIKTSPDIVVAEEHIFDFKAQLKPVQSPIKSSVENNRLSGCEPNPSALSDVTNNGDTLITSPPIPIVPARSSTLSGPALPTRSSSRKENPPTKIINSSDEAVVLLQKTDSVLKVKCLADVDILESKISPHKQEISIVSAVVNKPESSTPCRRPLHSPSKAPEIPTKTFPCVIDDDANGDTNNIDMVIAESEEIYADDEIQMILPPPDEITDDIHTDEIADDIYTDEIPEDIYTDEMPEDIYTDEITDDIYTDEITSLPDDIYTDEITGYDTVIKADCNDITLTTNDISAIQLSIPEEIDGIYSEDIGDYPCFKQVVEVRDEVAAEPTIPDYNINQEGEEDIYEDADMMILTPSQPLCEEYKVELEGMDDEDIYDDLENYRVNTKIDDPGSLPASCETTMFSQTHNLPESLPQASQITSLPPPPLIPTSAPPSCKPPSKQKQKSRFFVDIFKRGKKNNNMECNTDGKVIVENSSLGSQSFPEEEGEVYIDGEGMQDDKSDLFMEEEDDEPIYEEQ